MADILIRPYRPADRAAVRHLCCETADRGLPAESIYDDDTLVADLMTNYFIRHEPQGIWVADAGGQVVGYVTGTLYPARFDRWQLWWIVPRAVLSAVLRGALGRLQTRRLLRATYVTWRRGGFPRHVSTREYPAHLHVNIAEGFRGQRVGRRLVEHFLAHARVAGRAGVHVILRADNEPACRLFERLGFALLRRYPLVLPHRAAYVETQALVYGKRL